MVTRLLVVMDEPSSVNPTKDTTVAMLLEASRRGYDCHITTIECLHLQQQTAYCHSSAITVADQPDWYKKEKQTLQPMHHFDVILMRKDPPFDMRYIHATYMLEQAEKAGALVVNKPQALRDANEKLAALWFPQHVPETCVAANSETLRQFVKAQQRCVLKPLDGMGGRGIFMTSADDPNLNVIIETLTTEGSEMIMAQGYLDEISDGDCRVLIVDGNVVPYVLARVPGNDDFRGNLARGGSGQARPITATQQTIGESLAPELSKRGILFAGIDVIGDKLTEVNVTSPTCVRELDAAFGINICADLFSAIEERLSSKNTTSECIQER